MRNLNNLLAFIVGSSLAITLVFIFEGFSF